MSPDDLYLVRVGHHDCFDRVVFDVNGIIDGPDVLGYNVSYVPGEVAADGSGEVVATNGPAALQVIIRAPIYGTSGHQPWRPSPHLGDDLVPTDQLRGVDTIEQIAFAGSFEGQTTIAVGLAAELPFRVGAHELDSVTHLYVDVAHPR
jgi:hypothetical protein